MSERRTPTPAELAEWERLCEAATEGPWQPVDARGLGAPADCIDFAVVHKVETARVWLVEDTRFIAASREALPRLLATVRTQAALLKRARDGHVHTLASLVAAVSLLKRLRESAKKAAPSDKMFDQMVLDYEAAIERARALVAEIDAANATGGE